MALFEIRGLVKRFLGVTAVDGVDLTVERGELVSLIGPNGSGKTTLFNCVTGFLPVDDGRVLFRGGDVTGAPPHRIARLGVGRTFQLVSVFPRLSALENLLTFIQQLKPWLLAVDEGQEGPPTRLRDTVVGEIRQQRK